MFCSIMNFHCTVASCDIFPSQPFVLAPGCCDIFPSQPFVLAPGCCDIFRFAFDRSSGDIVLPQRLVLARGSDDIVLELFLCSLLHLTIALSIFPLAFGGYSARHLALALY